MINRLSTNLNATIQALQQAATNRDVATEKPAVAPSPRPAMPERPPSDLPLSAAEQQMIDREFPPIPKMNLRLYGPGARAQNANPTALGARLDLRG